MTGCSICDNNRYHEVMSDCLFYTAKIEPAHAILVLAYFHEQIAQETVIPKVN